MGAPWLGLLLWAPSARPTPHSAISLSYSHGILQGTLDLGLSQEHVAPAHPPEHALESRDALTVNDTSHEAAGRGVRVGAWLHAEEGLILTQTGMMRRAEQMEEVMCYGIQMVGRQLRGRRQRPSDSSQQAQESESSAPVFSEAAAVRTGRQTATTLTPVSTVCLFPSHSAPGGMRILPTGLDPPSADDAIQPEFTNQLISNENS